MLDKKSSIGHEEPAVLLVAQHLAHFKQVPLKEAGIIEALVGDQYVGGDDGDGDGVHGGRYSYIGV